MKLVMLGLLLSCKLDLIIIIILVFLPQTETNYPQDMPEMIIFVSTIWITVKPQIEYVLRKKANNEN